MKVTSDAIEGSKENFETMGNIVDNLDKVIKNIKNEVGTLRTEFDNISTKAQSIDDRKYHYFGAERFNRSQPCRRSRQGLCGCCERNKQSCSKH